MVWALVFLAGSQAFTLITVWVLMRRLKEVSNLAVMSGEAITGIVDVLGSTVDVVQSTVGRGL